MRVLAEAAQGEVVSAANLNSPDQVVIAGHAGAVNRAAELAKAAGARRAVLLPVSAPFHCALMAPAQERLRADLDATEFRDLAFPLVNNWQAREIRTGRGGARGRLPAGAEPGALAGHHPLSGGAGRRALRGGGRGRRADRLAAQHRSGARRALSSASRRTWKRYARPSTIRDRCSSANGGNLAIRRGLVELRRQSSLSQLRRRGYPALPAARIPGFGHAIVRQDAVPLPGLRAPFLLVCSPGRRRPGTEPRSASRSGW